MSRVLKYGIVSLLIITLLTIVTILMSNSANGVADYKIKCENSQNKIECLTSESLLQAKNSSLNQSLQNLNTYIKNSKIDEIECHLIYHAVGGSYYKEFGEKAYIPETSECYGSYYHGVILESSLNYKNSIKNYTSDILNSCNKLATTDFVNCIHGIGHGAYALSEGNVEKATEICAQVTINTICAAGVWMAFEDDPSHPTQFSTPLVAQNV